ncbi:hypothetical protein DM2_2924 [Halorubrum sp. DM2]|nr:hypothetical protein DM2_2924 [Halorubrum sp. DM2]
MSVAIPRTPLGSEDNLTGSLAEGRESVSAMMSNLDTRREE